MNDARSCWIEEKERIIALVMSHMSWTREKALMWFVTDNPMFGGYSAEYLVIRDRGHKVLKFIETSMEGHTK